MVGIWGKRGFTGQKGGEVFHLSPFLQAAAFLEGAANGHLLLKKNASVRRSGTSSLETEPNHLSGPGGLNPMLSPHPFSILFCPENIGGGFPR